MFEWINEEWVVEELGEGWVKKFKAKVLPLAEEYDKIKDRVDEVREIEVKITQELGYTTDTYYYHVDPIGLKGITEDQWLRRWEDWLAIEERIEEFDIDAYVTYYQRLLKLYKTHRRIKYVYSEEAKGKLQEHKLDPNAFYRFIPKQEVK